jgi:hypothetical protein
MVATLAGCGFGGGDSGKLDLTSTPSAPEPQPAAKGKPAANPFDTTPN